MVYQAIWALTSDFNEVLISRKMFSDHSPYVVLDALNKVILIACYNLSVAGFSLKHVHIRPSSFCCILLSFYADIFTKTDFF